MDMKACIHTAAEAICSNSSLQPQVGLIWRLLRRTAKCRQILFSELHVFPQATVEGHCSEFWIGTHQAIPVLALWGRLHYYEGYS